MELFKLLGTIAVDNNDANKAIDDTTDKAEGAKGKMSGAFSKIGQGAAVCGKAVVKGIAIGSAAMVGLTTKAMNLSGELEQNMGGSEAVFKDYAGKMQETAKTAFSNMGLSTSDFLGTANKMGALFQGAGFSIQESSDLSASAMQRAADVASIMGIDSASAMEAVAGAAKGNFTMMDNLGVAMNDTAIQNYALTKGINKTTAEMTQQEKIGLAMEMFMDKTSYAAGNYAKENETLAGSLGTAKSALTNFLDGSGSVEDVVKSFSGAANVIVKNLNELVPKLVNGITQLVQQIIPMLPPLLQSLLPGVIDGAVQLINGLVSALPMIIDALMAALPGLIEGVVQILLALSAALINSLPMVLPALIDGVIQLVVGLAQGLPQIIQLLVDKLPEIIISVVQALMNNLPTLIEGLVQLVVGIVQAIPQIILALIDALPTIIKSIVTGLWNALPVLLNGVIEMVGSIGKSVWSLLEGYWSRLGSFFKGIWDGIKNIFSEVGDWFSGIFKSAYNGITGIFSKIGGFFKDVFGKLGDIIKAPINFVIKGLNFLIGGLNKISFDVPDWIPVIGGKKFGFNIGKIAMLANGGVVDKATPSILGEDGAEAVVPLERNTGWIEKVANKIHDFTVRKSSADSIIPVGQLSTIIKTEIGQRIGNLEAMLASVVDVLKEFFPQLLDTFDFTLVMDDGTVAAKLTPKIDKNLGEIYKKKGRGN